VIAARGGLPRFCQAILDGVWRHEDFAFARNRRFLVPGCDSRKRRRRRRTWRG
jgi:hypothetical protein